MTKNKIHYKRKGRPICPPYDAEDVRSLLDKMAKRATAMLGMEQPLRVDTVKRCATIKPATVVCDFYGLYDTSRKRIVINKELLDECASGRCTKALSTLMHELRHHKQFIERGYDAFKDFDKPWSERRHEKDAIEAGNQFQREYNLTAKHPLKIMIELLRKPLTY